MKKYKIINEELKKYSTLLYKKPQMIVINKIDLILGEEKIDEISKYIKCIQKRDEGQKKGFFMKNL